jgi:hypothetical protein
MLCRGRPVRACTGQASRGEPAWSPRHSAVLDDAGGGTASATQPGWSGVWSKRRRACAGLGGRQGSANPGAQGSPGLCPCSSPVRVVAAQTHAAPGTQPATVMAWTSIHRGPVPDGGLPHGPSSASDQGNGPAWCVGTHGAARSTSGRGRRPSGVRCALGGRRERRLARTPSSRACRAARRVPGPDVTPQRCSVRPRGTGGRAAFGVSRRDGRRGPTPPRGPAPCWVRTYARMTGWRCTAARHSGCPRGGAAWASRGWPWCRDAALLLWTVLAPRARPWAVRPVGFLVETAFEGFRSSAQWRWRCMTNGLLAGGQSFPCNDLALIFL